MPLWAAVAIVAAALAARTVARGEFSLDAIDVLTIALLGVVMGIVAWTRRSRARDEAHRNTAEEHGDTGREPRDDRDRE
jgi:hypothetical protein